VQFADDRHATDDVLERYAMGRLYGAEFAEVEEHLLVCEDCQDRLAREDLLRQHVRLGGIALQQSRGRAPWRFPKPVWAAGLAAAALLVYAGIAWRPSSRPSAQPAVIFLQATRGADDPAGAVPARKPFTAVLDLTGLRPFPEYQVEIADAAGNSVFRSSGTPQNNKLPATLPKGLVAGTYYIRVYTPARELLREYPLAVHG